METQQEIKKLAELLLNNSRQESVVQQDCGLSSTDTENANKSFCTASEHAMALGVREKEGGERECGTKSTVFRVVSWL